MLVLRMKLSGAKRQEQHSSSEEFWAREHDARYARNKDISNIELFKPDLSAIPFSSSANDELHKLEEKLRKSAEEPMLDLHKLSNTDIKLTYGPANFPIISKYDQNYMYFTRDLFQLGKYLYNNNQHDASRKVLEHLLSLTQDIGNSYTMLGNIYKENDEPDKINELIQIVEKSDSFSKQSIRNSLRNIINSY